MVTESSTVLTVCEKGFGKRTSFDEYRVQRRVVLGGMGSIPGMFIAALILGVVESIVTTFGGPSWAPAVAFGLLLATLAFRPSGLFGR